MKPYQELTQLGKIRRLRRLTIEALKAYDLDIRRVRYLTTEINTMFRVDTTDDNKYVLRIFSDEETTLLDNQVEVFWLQAITRDTTLRVTEPVARRDGEFVSAVQVPGVPNPRRCVLFRWIPGRPLEADLNADYAFQVGEIMAALHNHSASLDLPEWVQPKRWDKVFYYPDEPVVYNLPACSKLFPPQRVALIDAVIERADQVFADLFADRAGLMLIHGDMHYWNLHVYRKKLYLIDFEDVMLGYPIQDLAVTFYYGRDRDDYPKLVAALHQGYTSIRPWPIDEWAVVETLIAARNAMFANYIARVDPEPDAETYIAITCKRLRAYLDFYG
jgi:Ser/Thr protein kinase RdoA (MazF antagonist)